MKKSVVSLVMLGAILSTNGVAMASISNNNSTVKTSIQNNQSSLVSFKYATNNLKDISSANPTDFDNPPVGEHGVLERMPSTTIETKYGDMSIKMDENGYTVTNTSNPNAPVMYVGGVNNIYRINGQVDLKGLLTPVLYNSQGEKIKGTIILPNVNTSIANYGEKYIEAIGENGAVTISPFIYNTVNFKKTIKIKSEEDIKSITTEDVLNGPSNNLHAYVAQYKPGDKNIIVGVSRGMASVREELPIEIGNVPKTETERANKVAENQITNEKISDTYKMPMLIRILTSKITYFVVGAILIAIIAFLCF